MLERHETLTVRQEVEALQAFSGLETENRYKIVDSSTGFTLTWSLSPRGEMLGGLERRMGFVNRRFDLDDHQAL